MKKELELILEKARKAQEVYSSFTQKEVDHVFRSVALAANENRILLAKEAVAETKRGIVVDKVVKNHFASEYIYNKYKHLKTVGTISMDVPGGVEVIAEPIGVVGAITPVTNPTSTAIFKSLLAIKTRNAIIVSPHPASKNCIAKTIEILERASIAAGAPAGLIQVVPNATIQDTQDLMKNCDRILATGGSGLVKEAYSSGTPAIGVGAGNCPAIIAKDADIEMAATSIIQSNTFDNGMICATENSVIVDASIYEKVKDIFKKYHGHVVTSTEDKNRVRKGMFQEGKFGLLHPAPIGQSAENVAKIFGIKVPSGTKLILVEAESVEDNEALSHEKLSTYVSLYKARDIDDAVEKAKKLLLLGPGHTASLFTHESNRLVIDKFKVLNAGRLLVNQPSSLGAIGDVFNFVLEPSMTLGCGSWGGNISSVNVGPELLLNTKKVVMRRENTLWLRVPKLYFKEGCTPEAFKDLIDDGHKKAFVVSDEIIWKLYGAKISKYLEDAGIAFTVFTDVEPNPTLGSVNRGLIAVRAYKPDLFVGFGGGSSLDAAKLMWLMYEYPEVKFKELALNFADIRKRIVKFPNLGKIAKYVAIPTTAGTGSEVTPFAVITDEKTHGKFPLADYALLPNMAVVDSQFQMTIPRAVTAVSGMDALTHSIESYISIISNEFTQPYSLQAIDLIMKYLTRAYNSPLDKPDKEARIGMAHAATLAGIAFANGFLGIVHSLSHKLGAVWGVIHGQANSIFLPYVIKYNSRDNEGKVQAFAQHKTPLTVQRLAEIAKMLKLKGKTDHELVDSLIDKVVEQTKSVGLKTSIKELVPNREEFMKSLKQMSEDAFDDQCTGANPRYPLLEDMEKLYIAAYDGIDPKKINF